MARASVEAEEMTTTVSYILPIRQVVWIRNEATRIANERGQRPNMSEVVREAIDGAMRESQAEKKEVA